MAKSNADRLRGIFERMFAGETLGPLELADDAEWVNPHDAVEPGTRSGAAGFNDAIRNVFATWDHVQFEIEESRESDDAVIVLGALCGRMHSAGIELKAPHGEIWTFRDGLVVRMQWFNSHAETLEAADAAPRAPTAVALIESAFEAFNRGDIAGFADHASEDVTWVEWSGRPEGPAGERHGRDRMRRSLEDLFEAWESYHLELEEVTDGGDRVLALVRETGRGRSSGVEVDSRWGYVITVADGTMARVEAYRDPAQAITAFRAS